DRPIDVFPLPERPTRMMLGFASATPLRNSREISLEISLHFTKRVAAEFFYRSLCDDECEHCFRNNSHRWYGGHIAALRNRRCSFARFHFDSSKRFHQCADWFHRNANDERLTVCHSA